IRVDHSLVELPADLPAGTLDRLARTRISGHLIHIQRDSGAPKPHRKGGGAKAKAAGAAPDEKPRKPRHK
ncbi:MAG: ATP-dependent RNA helicase, partial [Nocardioidaceae bacterium]|nr:ATP-dependent RNA helicase [Nocardioidaceae bacterium]